MPTLAFNRRQLRHTACVTLLAWVLALMSGVLNACLLQPHGETASVSSATSSPELADAGLIESTVAHVEHSHHDSHPAQHGDHDAAKDAGKAGCLKFCSDESSTLVKGKFIHTDLPNSVVVAVVEWPSMAPLPMGTLRMSAERPAFPGPPLVIRFLRLTI